MREMSGGLVRVLKDDDAMQGLLPSAAYTMLYGLALLLVLL